MIELLYGNLKWRNNLDTLTLPLKYLYVLYTFPTLIFIFLLGIRSGGVLGVPDKDGVGVVKLVVFRMSIFILSFGLWFGILGVIEDLTKL